MKSEPVPQRFVRAEVWSAPPGTWKKQLPTKYLKTAAKGDVRELEALLAEHPEYLNQRANHNRTLLWEATRAGKLAAVKFLIDAGAEVNATGCYNSETFVQVTPLCAAIYYERTEVAAFLRPIAKAQDVFRSAFLGDTKRVDRLLDSDSALLNAEDPFDGIYHVPLLTFAVAGGHLDVTRALVKRGADVAQYSSQLIQAAARLDRVDLLELLLDSGADIRAAGANTFVIASKQATVDYLLARGISANEPGLGGFPPIVFVARGDKGERPDKVRALLQHGADPNGSGPDGRTALHYAAAAGHSLVASLLLEHGARADTKDELGRTPVELAKERGKAALVKLLAPSGSHRE